MTQSASEKGGEGETADRRMRVVGGVMEEVEGSHIAKPEVTVLVLPENNSSSLHVYCHYPPRNTPTHPTPKHPS